MVIKITHDTDAPTAAAELVIMRPLPDYDLEAVEAPTPRDVDPILASQGFKDLLDEATAKVGEKVSIRRFMRYHLGEDGRN